LVEQGCEVLGVELAQKAVNDLFMQLGQSPTITIKSSFQSWASDGLEILVGDFFALDTEITGKFDAIWDRAAFVALRPSDRDHYALHLREFLRPNGYILLCTLNYDGEKMEGPPFNVSAEEVHRQFGNVLPVTKLEGRTIDEPKLCFGKSGLDWIIEETWLIG
jgi:thiopurine S-methyltransferase